jgi:hypothetical protein
MTASASRPAAAAFLAGAILVASSSAGCAGGPASPSSENAVGAETLATEHFSFEFPPAASAAVVRAIAETLEQEQARVVADLRSGPMPRVTVRFYANHAAMAASVAPTVGAIPSWATGLATAVDRIHVMTGISAQNVVHEFVHCVSMRINPTIANNPRWLWESIAVYEAGQSVPPRSLPYMTTAMPPAFALLNGFDNTLVYDVGYTISEFISAVGGPAALASLIANNGDVQATLAMSPSEFERAWYAFVRDRYGL